MKINNQEILEEYYYVLNLRGRSKLTIKNYNYTLKCFGKEINKKYINATTKDVRNFLMSKKDYAKNSTIKNNISVLRAFYNWLKEEHYIQNNPMSRIKKPRVVDNERRFLYIREVEKIRYYLNQNFENNFFDKVLFEVLYSSGLRVSEAVDLNWCDINFNKKEIKVIEGKGNKSRKTKLSSKAVLLLKEYKKKRIDDNEWIFQSQYNQRMSKESIERHINNLGKKVDIDINLTPHKLRHSFSTNCAKKGMPIQIIKELLGHSDIKTTSRYVHTSELEIEFHFGKVFA